MTRCLDKVIGRQKSNVLSLKSLCAKTFEMLHLKAKFSLFHHCSSVVSTMNEHLVQPHDGVSAEASALELMAATAVLAFLLHVFWRCCCSCFRHVKRCYYSYFSSCSSSSAATMDPSAIAGVEKILNYKFKNKRLLEEALTHSSFSNTVSFERLEFIGDAALGLAVATHFFRLGQLKLTPGQLTKLREKCVNNAKLARVAADHGLYRLLRKYNTASLDDNVREYERAVKDAADDHNITVKNPDILADVVEALAGAVYLDVNFDLDKLWTIFKDLLGIGAIILPKDGPDLSSEIKGAQNELHGLCGKRKKVKGEGPSHERKYAYSVAIEIEDVVLGMVGDEELTEKDARNSAAFLLIRFLQEAGNM
ncbi:hypothetical protein SCA6_018709 [Theobroma cacao]